LTELSLTAKESTTRRSKGYKRKLKKPLSNLSKNQIGFLTDTLNGINNDKKMRKVSPIVGWSSVNELRSKIFPIWKES
jgi:hypothetical protein